MIDSIPVKQLLRFSPAYFINRVYGYRVDGCHEKILDHLVDEKFGLTLVSRGHGKSRILGGYLTWLVCNNPNLRTILVSDTFTKSVLFLNAIKQTIESSPVIKEFYGDLRGDTWSNDKITIKGRDQIFVEPSILAVGAGSGQIVGMHADKIFVDDLVNYDSSRSELQRTRDREWYKTNLIPVLMSGGSIGIVGTRYAPTDFYQMVIDELKYKTLILPALNENNEPLCAWLIPYENELNGDGEIIKKGLKTIREELGSVIFAMQYNNNVDLANQNNIIQFDYIQYYDSTEYIDNQLYINNNGKQIKIGKIISAVDPAISLKDHADFTAITVIGKGKDDGNLYCLDTVNKHLTFHQQIQEIQRIAMKWQINGTVIEDVGFQKSLIQELKRTSGIKVITVKPARDKLSRLMSVSGFFENKKVHFLKKQNEIINQLLSFTGDGNDHDDLVDSITYALDQMKTSGSGMVVLRL